MTSPYERPRGLSSYSRPNTLLTILIVLYFSVSRRDSVIIDVIIVEGKEQYVVCNTICETHVVE